MTPHGFINDSDKSLKAYKAEYSKEWGKVLGGNDFKIVEEEEQVREINSHTSEPE